MDQSVGIAEITAGAFLAKFAFDKVKEVCGGLLQRKVIEEAAKRFTELKTCNGPTRSSSSMGGTTTTMIRLHPTSRSLSLRRFIRHFVICTVNRCSAG